MQLEGPMFEFGQSHKMRCIVDPEKKVPVVIKHYSMSRDHDSIESVVTSGKILVLASHSPTLEIRRTPKHQCPLFAINSGELKVII